MVTDWSAVTHQGSAGQERSESGGGPYFDDLAVGEVFDGAPSMTLTSGVAALHQGILGDRLRLPLDAELSHAVTGSPGQLAHPALVCDVAVGQSTVVTQRVRANLFYRGLLFHRYPVIGDSLFTRTEVVGLKQNRDQPGRARTGLAALRMTTVDQVGRLVLDFYRCAMLPCRPGAGDTGHADDLSQIGAGPVPEPDPTGHWVAGAFRDRVPGPRFSPELADSVLHSSADVVDSAAQLARLTLNVAGVHHDERLLGRRLVYGGHTIGLALAQAVRVLPNLVVVLGWQSCEHLGPVYEGDTTYSEIHLTRADPLPGDRGGVLGLRSVVYAVTDARPPRPVLDWRWTALHF